MPFATGRPFSRLTVILILLTGVTGVVEAASFLGLGRVFTAVMTGNILFFGFGLVDHAVPVAGPAVALAAFAVGALVGHRVNGVLSARKGERWLAFAVFGEGALLLVAAMLAFGLLSGSSHQPAHRLVVIVVLALAMGSRNATVLRVAAHDLPTTVVTRSLAGLLMLPGRETAGRRFATVAATFVGAVIGALLLKLHPGVPLLAASAVEITVGALCPRVRP
ncbi:YoaK family protein [Streptosporangium sp. NPDC000396]|uniref:YoaK family protein n=1 Tax=Streptosporangium sp. NPDC000396 TaxID=3366185 RepID=UPI0036D181C5